MPLSAFHPLVGQWFTERLGQPTPAQRRGWEAIRSGAHTLIAAPTGSGKTLAAFLIALDSLLQQSLAGTLTDEVQVIYVSPLKALSADIHKNLAEPRREIRRMAEALGHGTPHLTAAVRTGDTTSAERTAMLRTPPHILVTTPESLYLLLTAERSRNMLRTARTVIVDEIHAVVETRRGAHLALTLERLDHVVGRPLQRIGLSATQKPVEDVAAWLTGGRTDGPTDGKGPGSQSVSPSGRLPVIVDEGHRRDLDLALELPGSPLQAVMSAEVWEEIYNRLAQLVAEHRTTLVFVNTRRLAERAARHLSERLGEEAVTSHHGSLSKEARLDAEDRLKTGRLKALVATSSLELGIDIGHVDLVCQLGSPRRISTFLQRVGRSGHTVHATPKGRLFPLTRDELIECAALLRSVRSGELDRIVVNEESLDVLAQQIVAETAAEQWGTDQLYQMVRRARPYRDLPRADFDAVVAMLADGYVTRRGRRAALIHHDIVNRRIRGRRGARLMALMSGGAIPDNADYRVILEPEGTFIGTVNEDFAIESMAGDIFQLGNTSWRMLRIERGTVRVEDARGQPPGIPFWLGEAPARSPELSLSVSSLRRDLGEQLGDRDGATRWLEQNTGISPVAASQMVEYLSQARNALGVLPTQETLVAERFFDEAGGMQLVIHSPFGSRVNRAWGLALRKRFCRQFNFELQAAATEEAVLLSLGPQHSFPLETVFRFLNPESAEDILVQALLDAPVFATRWRWNANISLAVPRFQGGRKVPPQIQRMEADDLLAAAFPDAAACLENIPGDREIPDHPLVQQVLSDCLHEAMDLDRFLGLLRRIQQGEVACLARDLPEPSPLAHEILNAKPYAFLDDAPLEERRTQAVQTRRAFEPTSGENLGALDQEAIGRVRDEAWPDPENPDELYDTLQVSGFLTETEGKAGRDAGSWEPLMQQLEADGRAYRIGRLWVAHERIGQALAVYPDFVGRVGRVGKVGPTAPTPTREEAIRELLRGRMEILGPTTAPALAESLGIADAEAEAALLALEGEGVVLRGSFTARDSVLSTQSSALGEWCERRLLARIHRYTLNRLRAEIQPVSTSDFARFLIKWQRLEPSERAAGLEGLASVVEQLEGFEAPARSWEADLLGARCAEYDPQLLDLLCMTGRVAWSRLSLPVRADNGGSASRPIRSTPMALVMREHADLWLSLSPERALEGQSTYAQGVLEVLRSRGASFFAELVAGSGLLPTQVEQALGELAAAGLITSDSFAGLRALLTPSARRKPIAGGVRRHRTVGFGIESAGRWALVARETQATGREAAPSQSLEAFARVLLRRYGVVFNRILSRESISVPWRELLLIYRRLEARGEIRGGRFVAGVTGEQFALPEAVVTLRAVRRSARTGQLVSISAADPLNLLGSVLPGERIPALAGNRIVFEDGSPMAVLEAGKVRLLAAYGPERALAIERMLTRRPVSVALRAILAISGSPPPAPADRPRRRAARRFPIPTREESSP
ncbi:MAG TPA: DEAD/DEAH box helicase [Gemmatimonadales bacterium]